MSKKKPHAEAQAGVATGEASAKDAEPTATYTTPATGEAQFHLGRRLAPVNKEANETRTASQDASIARVLRLNAEKKTLAQIAESMGTSRRQVSTWLALGRKRAE